MQVYRTVRSATIFLLYHSQLRYNLFSKHNSNNTVPSIAFPYHLAYRRPVVSTMSPPPQVQVPDWCVEVGPQCPVEGTTYGYYPSLGWNAFFAGFFGLCAVLQLVFGVRYKTWTYLIAIFLGCAGECAGYVGRIMMHNNPYDKTGFQIQIVLLIFSPAFLAAGIYLTLKHVVLSFGEEWSRLKPNWYTYIFIGCDISSLVLQSAGGGIAATAEDGDKKTLDAGTNIMIAGIIWQVVGEHIHPSMHLEHSSNTPQCSSSSPPSS